LSRGIKLIAAIDILRGALAAGDQAQARQGAQNSAKNREGCRRPRAANPMVRM
jgi:hypothetical protein